MFLEQAEVFELLAGVKSASGRGAQQQSLGEAAGCSALLVVGDVMLHVPKTKEHSH